MGGKVIAQFLGRFCDSFDTLAIHRELSSQSSPAGKIGTYILVDPKHGLDT